jgi:hypothetical protein
MKVDLQSIHNYSAYVIQIGDDEVYAQSRSEVLRSGDAARMYASDGKLPDLFAIEHSYRIGQLVVSRHMAEYLRLLDLGGLCSTETIIIISEDTEDRLAEYVLFNFAVIEGAFAETDDTIIQIIADRSIETRLLRKYPELPKLRAGIPNDVVFLATLLCCSDKARCVLEQAKVSNTSFLILQ